MNQNDNDPNREPPENRPIFPIFRKQIIWYVLAVLAFLIVLSKCAGTGTGPIINAGLSPPEFEQMLKDRRIAPEKVRLKLSESLAYFEWHDPSKGIRVRTQMDREKSDVYERIINDYPAIVPNEKDEEGNWSSDLFAFLPFILMGALFFFMMRSMRGTQDQTMSMGHSRARTFTGNLPKVRFLDVAGVEEAKEELQEVVEFLKFPMRFQSLGAKIPRGVLMTGPPGTGKTLLARAVAGEAGVPFFSMVGSEFVEMFVGVGASRVRDLFSQAKRNAPCIIFVDEIDAVGRHRGAGLGGGHDEREQTLNQILTEMDGFDEHAHATIIVLAATNRPDILDAALLRPGRFDRKVVLDLPDSAGRKAILAVHAQGKPFGEDVLWDKVARETSGFSGADLANLLNEAAILAVRNKKNAIGLEEISESITRVTMGPQRKTKIISPEEKIIAAYHEAGHAVVAREMPHLDPVHKISIIARGTSGGFTQILPEKDRSLYRRDYLEELLCMMLGGRVSEALNCADITTGASDDLQKATKLAREMITQYGMSKLGLRTYEQGQEVIFLGREISGHRDYSDDTAREIDSEVKSLLKQAEFRAKGILEKRKHVLSKIVEVLLEHETLEGSLLDQLLPREV